jgi:hypothetical protein
VPAHCCFRLTLGGFPLCRVVFSTITGLNRRKTPNNACSSLFVQVCRLSLLWLCALLAFRPLALQGNTRFPFGKYHHTGQ